MFERSNARQLEACQKQLNLLQLQVKQTSDDRDALDGQLPRGGGPIAAPAAAAEKDLAALEELMPLDARLHGGAGKRPPRRGERVAAAEQDIAAVRRRWRRSARRRPACRDNCAAGS